MVSAEDGIQIDDGRQSHKRVNSAGILGCAQDRFPVCVPLLVCVVRQSEDCTLILPREQDRFKGPAIPPLQNEGGVGALREPNRRLPSKTLSVKMG